MNLFAWQAGERAGRRDIVFCAVMAVICVALWYLPTGFEDRLPEGTERVRGRVTAVDDSLIAQHGIIRTGSQGLEVELLEGKGKGRHIATRNQLSGKLDMDKIFAPGDIALMNVAFEGTTVTRAHAVDFYRLNTELYLLGLFALALVMFAGFTGLRALLAFLFTALCLWKVLVPALLLGFDPIPVTFGIVSLLTGVTLFLVSGLNRRGLVAYLGTLAGVGATCLLAVLFTGAFRVNGAVRPFAETLLHSGFYALDLRKIFQAGIFLASSGAVMDLAMDISSAMSEIARHTPRITRRALLESGFLVSRAVIGCMTTTLILAYSGNCLTMLMLFMGQGIPMENVLNLNFVASEILHTLAGSFGLVLVAPLTVFIGCVAYAPAGARQ